MIINKYVFGKINRNIEMGKKDDYYLELQKAFAEIDKIKLPDFSESDLAMLRTEDDVLKQHDIIVKIDNSSSAE
jgi:hypothetical protein